jgi:hypothetical protein
LLLSVAEIIEDVNYKSTALKDISFACSLVKEAIYRLVHYAIEDFNTT